MITEVRAGSKIQYKLNPQTGLWESLIPAGSSDAVDVAMVLKTEELRRLLMDYIDERVFIYKDWQAKRQAAQAGTYQGPLPVEMGKYLRKQELVIGQLNDLLNKLEPGVN